MRFLLLIALLPTLAQAATATSTCTAASGWATTPTNALVLDAALATTVAAGQPLLSVTTCAMALPAGATVTGIQVHIVGCGSGTSGQKQLNLNILGLGTCTAKTLGTTPATCATLTTQDVPSGVTNDLWSCTGPITDTTVNATTFGASVQTNTSNTSTNSVDLVSLIVTYTPTAGAASTQRRVFQF